MSWKTTSVPKQPGFSTFPLWPDYKLRKPGSSHVLTVQTEARIWENLTLRILIFQQRWAKGHYSPLFLSQITCSGSVFPRNVSPCSLNASRLGTCWQLHHQDVFESWRAARSLWAQKHFSSFRQAQELLCFIPGIINTPQAAQSILKANSEYKTFFLPSRNLI